MMPFTLRIKREHVLASVCVILRVPSLFIMDAWYRSDPWQSVDVKTSNTEFIVTGVYYLILAVALMMLVLPLRKLVLLYMYFVSLLLLGVAYKFSHLYVETEKTFPETSVFSDISGLRRITVHLTAQCIIAAFVAYLIDIHSWSKFMLLAYTLPMLARMVGMPSSELEHFHHFSTTFSVLIILLYAFNNIGNILNSIKENINRALAMAEAIGWITLLYTIWHTVLLPVQFLVFWLTLFGSQLYVYIYWNSLPTNLTQEGWVLILLACIGECCSTPISLIALCITIAYASCSILSLTKLFLQGWTSFTMDSDLMRGWTEGFTMLLIAVQTGLLDLKPLQRAFLMSVLLFIVASSLIQSIYEMADPILLSLSASHNKNVFKHIRAVALFTFLWMFPLYMTYSICQYFDLDFWLLVIMSSCLLTTVQVIGSLVIYSLLMYDCMRTEPWESLDDVVYYTRCTVRILEFIVAVFIVVYGLKESFFGEWSWINSSILIIHCYFNVWQRLQNGWKIFLLRREAVKRLGSLPIATDQQLQEYSDVCPICYQPLLSARITHCGHYFHATCLIKWLYVKDTCPMCHKKIHQPSETTNATDTRPDDQNQEARNQDENSESESADNEASDDDLENSDSDGDLED